MNLPRAVLDTDPRGEADRIGFLRYEAPDGRMDVIMVTDGPSFELYPHQPRYEKCPVWHIDLDGDIVTVSPSIDIKDRYHTGNPVRFRLVPSL